MLKRTALSVSLAVLGVGSPVFADGTLTSNGSVTASVVESIGITTALSSITLSSIDVLDATAASGSGTFTVKANSATTVYDVWLSVPQANLDATNDVYVALSGSDGLPLNVSLTGNSGANSVNANSAALQTGAPSTARPTTGSKSDGDAVAGTNRGTGTAYTVTLTENTALAASYPEIPAGTYTLTVTANIAHGD